MTPQQQTAVDHILALYATQEAELHALFLWWPATDGADYRRLDARTIARADAIYAGFNALHDAYGGIAPQSVTVPLVQGHYSRLAQVPDAGELSEMAEREGVAA